MVQKIRECVLKSERGAYMLFFALLLPFFLGVIGFAIDAAFLYAQKGKLQDVADSAALAAAAHLNDDIGVREINIRNSIKAYAAANGFKDDASGNNFVYLDDKQKADNIMVKDVDAWKIVQAVDTKVTDKDGIVRDQVRVVIIKRVPTFFIGLLFPDQRNGIVVRAAAGAEYVKNKGYSVPKIFCSGIAGYGNNKTVQLERGQDFSVLSDIFSLSLDAVIPYGSTGSLYTESKVSGSVQDGWNIVSLNRDAGADISGIADKIILLREEKERTYQGTANSAYSDKRSYIMGIGNRRYIGYSSTQEIVNNIRPGDNDIELYMDATYGELNDNHYVILTDSQLRGVKKVKKLVFGKDNLSGTADYRNNIISTTGVDYGDIYSVYRSGSVSISGKNNYFSGVIYTPGTLKVGGTDNWFNVSAPSEFFADRVEIGSWDKITLQYIADIGKDRILSVNNLRYSSDDRIYWGNYQDNDNVLSGNNKWHTRLVY